MKTITKLTAALALAAAVSAPAFAADSMKKSHKADGTHAQASVPVAQPTFDPAAFATEF